MLCVYMRPWTLKPAESTRLNPLLSVLGKCVITTEADIPVWTQLQEITQHIKHTAVGQDSATHTSAELSECYTDNNYNKQKIQMKMSNSNERLKNDDDQKANPIPRKQQIKKSLMPPHGGFTSTEMSFPRSVVA